MFEIFVTGMALLSGAIGLPNWQTTILVGMTTGLLTGASISEIIAFIRHDESKRLLAFPIGGILGVIFTILLFVL